MKKKRTQTVNRKMLDLVRRQSKIRDLDRKLYKAARIHDLDTVKYLIEKKGSILHLQEGKDIHHYDNDENGLLHLAVSAFGSKKKGAYNKALVVYLLDKGANVNARNRAMQTPLHYAVLTQDLELFKLLIEHGADPSLTEIEGDNALGWAAYTNALDIAKYLIEGLGSDVHHENNDKYTPLHWACYKGHTDIVELLIQHGADIHKENAEGKSALACAVEEGREETVERIFELFNK